MHGLFLYMKKGATFTSAFQNVLNESWRKPNKIWVDKSSEFHSRSVKSWLQENDIEMYSTHNEGQSVVPERFTRTLKNKIYKHMNSVSKKAYVDKPDDILEEYSYTYHSIIKINPVDVKSSTYIDFCVKNNDKDPKFQDYNPNWLKILWLKKVNNTFPWIYVIEELNGQKIIGKFCEKGLQKTNQIKFRTE